MTTAFDSFNLLPELGQAVAQRGYTDPTPIQSAVIPLMLAGHDVIGQAQTGTGKTAAFALPMLHNLQPGLGFVQGLVLAPTRELALQVAEAFQSYGQFASVKVLAVYGGAPYGPQISALKRGVDIVVGTPGRLMDLMRKGVLDIRYAAFVVLDEADEMLSMGFAEDIETILAATPETRQTALFSATLPAPIRSLAARYLRDPQTVTIQREQVTGAGIEQRLYFVHQSDKTAALARIFEAETVRSALIFVRTRAASSELANALTARGYPAEALNGDLNQDARERTLGRFREGKITVLVATDVAARGLDIDDISHVFNYDLPEDPEIYVHRIGRTGRAGKTGIAISLAAPYEMRYLYGIESFTRQKLDRPTLPSEIDIRTRRDEKLLNQVKVWLQRARYKRERELVEGLVAEGFDPLDIAAAALKVARAEDKQRPLEPITILLEERPTRRSRSSHERSAYERPAQERSRRPTRFGSIHTVEDGMVRLSMEIGKQHGVRPADVVGVIAAHANIPGSSIGKIVIFDHHTLVDVPAGLAAQVMRETRQARIKRQPLDLKVP
jgi:ATP-dependent RNA helicase DeaD